MKAFIGALGVFATMLGGLWLSQGLGLVHLRPILCFADCAAIQGRSTTWTVIGLFVIAAGALAIAFSLRRR